MTRPSRFVPQVFILAIIVAGIRPATAKGQSTSEEKAHEVLKRNQDAITFFMHPTATFKQNTFQKKTPYASGSFRLTYRYNFDSAFGKRFYSDLHFNFKSNGLFDYLAIGETEARVNPFTAANQAINWAKQNILRDNDLQNNETVIRIIDQADAKRLLEWIVQNRP